MRTLLKFFLLGFLLRMMPGLPTVGADTDQWGSEINAFLAVAHDPNTGGLLDSAVGKATINEQTGTAYTVTKLDQGRIVSANNAAANTVTFPSDANMSGGAMDIGAITTIRQAGAGATAIAAGSGAVVRARGLVAPIHLAGQYAYATAVKVAANTYEVSGDIVQ